MIAGNGGGGRIKGRGATANVDGRFAVTTVEAVHDGWEADDPGPPDPRTTVAIEQARSVLSYNRAPDLPFDRSLNAYRGCEHGLTTW